MEVLFTLENLTNIHICEAITIVRVEAPSHVLQTARGGEIVGHDRIYKTPLLPTRPRVLDPTEK